MSQIVSGFAVTPSLLDQLLPTLDPPECKAFWTLLKDLAAESSPTYSYSGSVLSIALAHLEDKAVTLPIFDSHVAIRAMLSSGVSSAMCCDAKQSEAIVANLEWLQPDKNELDGYLNEFTDEGGTKPVKHFRKG